MRVRIIKLGGSLLEIADWTERLCSWIDQQPPASNCLIVGGGPPVDALRELPNLADYDDQFLHWLCIDLMEITHRLVQHQLINWHAVQTSPELQTHLANQRSHILVSVKAFYTRESETQLDVRLPMNWDTTSDSLSALLARLTQAEELVLLKSCGPIEQYVSKQPDLRAKELKSLVEDGAIDRAMPNICQSVPSIRLVNLRSWFPKHTP